MIIKLVNLYVSANILLMVAAAALGCLGLLARRLQHPLRFKHQLMIGYLLIVSVIVVPLQTLVGSRAPFLPPTAQVWAAPTMKGNAFSTPHAVSLPLTDAFSGPNIDRLGAAVVLLFVIGLLAVCVRLGMDLIALRNVIKHSFVMKRCGAVKILVSDRVSVPLSFWWPGHYFVVVSARLVPHMPEFRIAVLHEIQHHRQHDTKWLHVFQVMRGLFFWNPAAHFLERCVADLQEFACDEALAGHRGVSPQAYSRCLLWVAETSLGNHRSLAGTASMARGNAGKILRRRVEIMLSQPKAYVRKSVVAVLGTASIVLMMATAYAASETVVDRRISLDDANRLAAIAGRDSEFPIVVNELVLEQLNRFLGTPDGRDYMKRALAQMENYREVVGGAISSYKLPIELMAVPVIESGYRNLPQLPNPAHGAGIWMFIASTARHYGLRVDGHVDERVNVALETDAAMRLLQSLNLRFNDWGLALLGYNGGADMVQKGIHATGSRDVWELIRNGYENDPKYVAEVIAAVLILKNPASLN